MTAQARWRKSSHSGMTDDSSCVEVARLSGAVGVRDSKSPATGNLALPFETFADLVVRIKRDELAL
ncbi:DUF397 domain-containing protein [Spirillospora sp. NPDC048823]|uniref:DUF397 domain-containing protein n=1 Tax=unclassified Spirillospora TaxID=2642701 RepID=UPI00371D35A3